MNPSEYEAFKWIKATLDTANVGADVYSDVIPAGAAMPAIRTTCQSRNDVRTNAQHIAISTWRFLVVATSSDLDDVVTTSKAIDAALHLAVGETDDLRIIACTRISTYSSTSNEQGEQFRIGGAVYELVGAAAA